MPLYLPNPTELLKLNDKLIRVEAYRIGDVECLGADLSFVFFVVNHGEPFGQSRIDREESEVVSAIERSSNRSRFLLFAFLIVFF